jgi:hypothetical protein
MDKDILYWINLSNYDIATAKAMLAGKRYLYVLFTCQQSIEKMLKALVVQTLESFLPRFTIWSNCSLLPESRPQMRKRNFSQGLTIISKQGTLQSLRKFLN